MRRRIILSIVMLAFATAILAQGTKDEEALTGLIAKAVVEYNDARSQADAKYAKQVAPLLKRHEKQRRLANQRAANKAISRLETLAKSARKMGSDLGEATVLEEIEAIRADVAAGKPALTSKEVRRWKFKNHSYLAVVAPVTWQQAREICEDMGGRLVCIETFEELDFLKKLIRKTQMWVGASDQKKEGRWRWLNGEPIRKRMWKDGQPNGKRKENAAILYESLHDAKSKETWIRGFICEWE